MKAISCEKQSIAWFKLAECVERGEKERALNLFRLLTIRYPIRHLKTIGS